VPLKILGGLAEKRGVVTEAADALIVAVTEKRADAAGGMAVIDSQAQFMAMPDSRLRLPAASTHATLPRRHLFVIGYR
jgi:hypothetical protein